MHELIGHWFAITLDFERTKHMATQSQIDWWVMDSIDAELVDSHTYTDQFFCGQDRLVGYYLFWQRNG